MANSCVTILPIEQVIGLSFMAFTGFLSAFAVIFVLCLVARNYLRNVRNPPPGGDWKLIRTHVDAYLLSLLAADLMQSVGAILEIKWVTERQVYCSPTCTGQGIIKVIGETGVAMSTLAITIHTFLVIFFRWSPSQRSSWIWKVVIAFIWIYVSLYGVIGYITHHRESNNTADIGAFYTPIPYWCWISGNFNVERITAEYLWLWLAAFSSIILYTLLFFRVRGNITVDPLDWRHIRFKWHRWHSGDEGDGYFGGTEHGARGGEAGKTAAREAMSMIWYPITYTALVLPLSVFRWLPFRSIDQGEPYGAFAFAAVSIIVFGLSGIVNVALILLTRKNLLLFGQRGIVNPAKIGPAATGRLPIVKNNNNGGRDGRGAAGGAVEKKGKFHLLHVIVGGKHCDGGKEEPGEDSTSETSEDKRRQRLGGQGDTNFVVSGFTTQAFETQRSFDVSSNRAPFSPISDPMDTANTMSMPFSLAMDEEQSCAYGHAQDGGIPEGMSRDLGSAREYDIDRERDWRSLGSVRADIMARAYLTPEDARGRHQISEGETTQADVSNPSNFLEMKDSRSYPGQSEGTQSYPQYPPPAAPLPSPPAQNLYAEGQRGSAGIASKNPWGSHLNSAKSRTGSPHHQPSGDLSDYSVPMKFNPTPAPIPPVPSTTATITAGIEAASDSRSPYTNKSRSGSEKSLGKSTSTTPATTTTATTKTPWSVFTSIFSKSNPLDQPDRSKYEYGPSPPDSGQSDSRLLVPTPVHPHRSHQPEAANIRPLHFSRDFGPNLRSNWSDAELERSSSDDAARLEHAPSHEALTLARTRTGNSSQDGAEAGDLYGGSWSRASAGRRGWGEDDTYPFRLTTAGSNRSYTSGPHGFSMGGGAASASAGSLRDAAPAERGIAMQERRRHVPMPPLPLRTDSWTIGRAL